MTEKQPWRVVTPYRPSNPDPISVRAGDVLIVGKEDIEYPGWVWCEGPDGRRGWVPTDCVDNSRALYDYTAVELLVSEGELLLLIEEKNAWAFCTNEEGEQGWLPVANLKRAE